MKPTEQRILEYFNTHPDNEQSTSEIQIALDIGQANCSRYLSNMVNTKTLSKRKMGRQIFYSLFGKNVNIHTNIHTYKKVTPKKKSNTTKKEKIKIIEPEIIDDGPGFVVPQDNNGDNEDNEDTKFDLKKYEDTMNDLLGMNDPVSKSSKKAIELPLILLTEVLDDIRSRKVKGFNLSSKKWNDKPYREMFETTLRLLKEKIK